MIDLTGPARPWSDGLGRRFAHSLERATRSPWWRSPAPHGDPRLLERLAELFGEPPDRTVVTGGVRQFATCWVQRTIPAAVETPTFCDVPELLEPGGPVRAVSWTALMDGSALSAGPELVWLTSPFRNPDGRSLDPDGTATVAGLVDQGHTVVVNQVYRWFVAPEARVAAPAGAWTVTSLAKLAGGGARLGWAVAPTAEDVTRTLTSHGPPSAWQRAWADFLDPPAYRALWADCVEPTLAAARAFAERIGELTGWRIPDPRPAVMLECHGMEEPAALELLAERGLAVSPGAAFGAPRPSVRLAFSGSTVTQAQRAADTVAKEWHRFGPALFG